jgi:inner membrane protein
MKIGDSPSPLVLIAKMFILGAMLIAFGITLLIIEGVVSEREGYRNRVVLEIAQSTAKAQVLAGPVLAVGFRERVVDEATRNSPRTTRLQRDEVVLLPESLDVRTRVRVEQRARGIYKAQVFRSTSTVGCLRAGALGIAANRDVVPTRGRAPRGGISDARGIRSVPAIRSNGQTFATVPGTGRDWLPVGFSADLGPQFADGERRVPFEIDLELLGTDQLSVVPVGDVTTVHMESDWPHPSFQGAFLPDERTVTSHGFDATWRLSRFATGVQTLAEQWRHGMPGDMGDCQLSVKLVQPVDVYQQSTRAVKYGMLFVLLTFVVFLLYEVLKRLAVHPVQYGLVGTAVALFFLLLVSLSEHIAFVTAYVIASVACVGLITFYVAHVLRSARRGLAFGALLAALYAVLYVLLQSEDYALLLGSLLLFGVLALVMVITRRVDWYRVGATEKPAT